MRDRLLAVPLVALCLAAMTACTTDEPGKPNPGPATGAESAPPESSTPATDVAIPARPKDLPLDAVAPCSLFTEAQLDQLKVDRTRERTSDSETYSGAKECVLNVSGGEPFYDYSALLVTTEGIEPWLGGDRNVEAQLTSVAGFPAATFHFLGAEGTKSFECVTAVDVAKGQQLQVDITLTTDDAFTQDQMCQMSEQAASLAVTTLQTLK